MVMWFFSAGSRVAGRVNSIKRRFTPWETNMINDLASLKQRRDS